MQFTLGGQDHMPLVIVKEWVHAWLYICARCNGLLHCIQYTLVVYTLIVACQVYFGNYTESKFSTYLCTVGISGSFEKRRT